MPHNSLLLADVDGTLVTEQKMLAERAPAAFAATQARRMRFAIASSRPPHGLMPPNLTVIKARSIPPKVARRPIAAILDHKMDAWLYAGTEWLVHNDQAPHVAREQWIVKFPPKVVARRRDYR